MKIRNTAIVMAILMVFVFLAACNSGNDSSKDHNGALTTTILSGGTADKWFMLSNGFAEVLNRTYPGSILHIAPGTTAANYLGLDAGEAEFGLTHTNLAFDAYNGTGQFDEVKDNVAAVALLYSSPAQMIFRKDSGITSFEEILKDKIPVKINAGRSGSSMETAFQKMIGYYGVTFDDMLEWGCTIYKKGFADTSDLFADEAIDGFFIVAGAPTLFPTQLSVNTDMIMIEFEPELIDYMCEEHGFSYYTIPKETYTFMESDANSFNSYTFLCASKNTTEDTVYKFTKAVYENVEYIQSLHASFLEITGESLAGDAEIAYHPGAVRYYDEIGLMDSGN